jgi:hypothetical protein
LAIGRERRLTDYAWPIPTDIHPSALGSHNWFGHLEVDDVDALHAEFAAREAIRSAPRDTHYGMREIVVTTIDGAQSCVRCTVETGVIARSDSGTDLPLSRCNGLGSCRE